MCGRRGVGGVVCPVDSARATRVGTVTQLSGSAQIQRGTANIPVAQGTAVELHDRVATAARSTATLTSGSSLTLYYNSSLVFDQAVVGGAARGSTTLRLLEGAMRSVVPALVQTQSFEIHTPNATAAVRGTDFDTSYFEGTGGGGGSAVTAGVGFSAPPPGGGSTGAPPPPPMPPLGTTTGP